jgi:pimeloyl-ACP methyl ester carboxylesterase
MLRVLGVSLVLALAVTGSAEAAADFSHGRKCGESNLECTRVSVPLDRSGALPGKLSLYVERTGPARDVIVALAGGPGQGNSTVSESFNRDLSPILDGSRDLVVFDQRGTGKSGALNCPELETQTKRPLDVRAEACARRLGPKRALFTTRDSVEDLEAVRRKIGRDKITLYGVSYGTKVALAYALRYPEHVRRIILDSVVEPEGQSAFDVDTYAALPRVLREICRGECRGVTEDLAADVAALAAQLRAAPLRGTWVGRSGRARTVELTERGLYLMLRQGDLLAFARAEYPGAIRSALDGDPAPLLRIEHRFDGLPSLPPPPDAVRALSFSLFTATLCEEAPLPWDRTAGPDARLAQARERAAALPDSAFAPFDRDTSLALDYSSLLLQCLRWPAAAAPPALAPGPLPDVPVLILEGQEDLRTPLEVGTRLATRFPQATVVAVPKTAHAVLGQPGAACVGVVLGRWYAGRAVGSACAGARRGVRVDPVLPASLTAVAPAKGVSGTRGRTLAATLLTLRDMYREYYAAAGAFAHIRGGGLRGGSFLEGGRSLRLSRLSLVPGVALSGRLVDVQRPAGVLTVAGAAASRGRLTLARNGTVTGRLGGRAVKARFRPPSPAFGG